LTVRTFLSSAVAGAAHSLVEDDLVTKVYFPRPLAPLAAVLAATVEMAITLVLLIPVLAIDGIVPPIQVLTLPTSLLGAVLLAIAVGVWLAAANVLYRDVRYVLSFLLQLWEILSRPVDRRDSGDFRFGRFAGFDGCDFGGTFE
jgi:lipopolysaccharide transport system permease protein